MKVLRIVLLFSLVAGAFTQDGLDLSDISDDPVPTPAKPKETQKAPEKPKTDGRMDLTDALGGDAEPSNPRSGVPDFDSDLFVLDAVPKKPSSGDSGLDLSDILDYAVPTPAKPKETQKAPEKPKTDGWMDLADALEGDAEPSNPRSGVPDFDSDLFVLEPKKPRSGVPGGLDLDLDDDLQHSSFDAVKPTDKPRGGDCQGTVVQKLATVIENQNEQLRLLRQLMARQSSARPMR